MRLWKKWYASDKCHVGVVRFGHYFDRKCLYPGEYNDLVTC